MSEVKDPKDIQILRQDMEMQSTLNYGVSLNRRSFSLVGEIGPEMYLELDAKLTLLESQSNGREAITIRINSPGGSVYDAVAIVGRIKRSPAYIITEGVGHVMSAATLILACGRKRRMHELCTFMHHEFCSGDFATITQNKHSQRQTDLEYERWCSFMAKFSTTPASFWLEKGRNGIDLYLNAQECKDLGVIDEIF